MALFKINLIVFVLFLILYSVRAFSVYWNAPTEQCLRNYGHDFAALLRTYNIFVNDGDKFRGNHITIFYEPNLGLYPEILRNGTFQNGGLPQAGNLSKHLAKSAEDIKKFIPNEQFNGVGVIDWEAWRPSWNFNWTPLKIYQEESKELVRKHNQSLDNKAVEELAKIQWENGAKSYMLETLLLAKKMRPLADWGFYLFPDCYNYAGKKPGDFECSKKVKTENDKLSWLWELSSSIHSSIYIYESHLNHYTLKERSWKDNGKLQETIRVAAPNAKILPYINYFLSKEVVPEEDFRRMVGQAASVGADGVVIWGSSSSVNSRKRCDDLRHYIVETLGPTVERVSWNYKSCSKKVCNGKGSCTWPNDTSIRAWTYFLIDKPSFNAADIVCKCKSNYTGRFCDTSR